jgi:DNA polymerase-3 subunit alpha
MKAGALDSLGTDRSTLIGNLEEIIKFSSLVKKSKNESQAGLFGGAVISPNALKLTQMPEIPSVEQLQWEKELIGFYISSHPLEAYKEKLTNIKARPIKDALLIKAVKEEVIVGGIVVAIRKIITKTNKPMMFVTLEDMGGTLDVIVFPKTLEKGEEPWQVGAVIAILGHMSWRDDEPSLIAEGARIL